MSVALTYTIPNDLAQLPPVSGCRALGGCNHAGAFLFPQLHQELREMSLVLTYTLTNDLSQLHDEILRAGITPELVQGDGDDITLTLPDGTDEPTVDGLIAAHVPQARYDPPTRLREVAALRRDAGRAALRARAAAATTVADLRAVLLAHLTAEEEDAG